MPSTTVPTEVDREAIQVEDDALHPLPESTLILGWNWRGSAIARELDHYVPAGSQLSVVAGVRIEPVERSRIENELIMQQVSFHQADITDRDVLDSVMRSAFDHVIVLSDGDGLAPQAADARTLMTLLHLRDIAIRLGVRFSTVTEINDLRNQRLAEITGADDFIVSDHLLSLVLTQVAEQKELAAVLADLFDHEACEIKLQPAGHYVAADREVSYATIVAAARSRDEVAIGYRFIDSEQETELGHGVVIDPPKSARLRLSASDRVIVLSDK